MSSVNIRFFSPGAFKFFLTATLFVLFSALAQASSGDSAQESTTHHAAEAPAGHEASAEHGAKAHGKEPFKVDEVIMHHISDAHGWHFMTVGHTHVTLPLPVILYSSTKGFQTFMSGNFNDEHHNPVAYNGYKVEHGHIISEDPNETIYDLSITKNVAQLLLIVTLMLLLFIPIARTYARMGKTAPKGMQNFFEIIIIFIRDEVAKPNMGKKAGKFMPYLLTLFFFIWFLNLAGLLPGSANVTGNIAVTMVLALFTLIITNVNGNKHYWSHTFNTPGVPWWLKTVVPIMPLVEMLSIFTKPFALMIRLFANITAGHIIILSIVGLIFMFGEQSIGAGYGVSVVSVAFGTFLFCLELLVALIQAYIFTMLTSLFIGQAVEDHDDHH